MQQVKRFYYLVLFINIQEDQTIFCYCCTHCYCRGADLWCFLYSSYFYLFNCNFIHFNNSSVLSFIYVSISGFQCDKGFVNAQGFYLQGLDRGPKLPFPSYGSFISTLNHRRESGSHSFSSPLLLPAVKQGQASSVTGVLADFC